MKTETYRKLYSHRGKAADEHYRCMRTWLAKRFDPSVGKGCLAAALEYQKALEKELAYLQTRPQTADVIRRTTETRESITLIAKDIQNLTGH